MLCQGKVQRLVKLEGRNIPPRPVPKPHQIHGYPSPTPPPCPQRQFVNHFSLSGATKMAIVTTLVGYELLKLCLARRRNYYGAQPSALPPATVCHLIPSDAFNTVIVTTHVGCRRWRSCVALRCTFTPPASASPSAILCDTNESAIVTRLLAA